MLVKSIFMKSATIEKSFWKNSTQNVTALRKMLTTTSTTDYTRSHFINWLTITTRKATYRKPFVNA